VAGIALIAIGLACWPGSEATGTPARALRAMMCYSLIVTLYLAYLRIRGGMGRGSVVAGGGDPRRVDVLAGTRMDQGSAETRE
jgi:hypothetical protein